MQEPVEVGRGRDSLDKKLNIQGVPIQSQCFFFHPGSFVCDLDSNSV